MELKTMAKKPTKIELDAHAAKVRAQLSVPRQSEVFRAAVEAGYLAATSDGTFDDAERAALVRAIDILSQGAVVEWEAEDLVEAAAKETGKAEDRAKRVGAKLKELGAPEAGLLFAAFVAHATQGIDKKEEAVLRAIAKAGGVTDKRLREMLKEVGAEPSA
jgi:tellurite resistance protein